MKKYIFYSKTDPNKEIISTTTAKSLYIATVKFAELKKLDLEKFNNLFKVERE